MKLLKNIFLSSLLFCFGFASAQDDLLNELNLPKSEEKEITTAAFKALQICNIQSTKLPVKGEWYFLISHRFGDLTQGLDNFFGLDNALAKIGGIYGVTDWLSLGASRHTYNKIYELTAKYKLANQLVEDFPVTIVGYNTFDINSNLKPSIYPDLQFNDRLAFSSQLIISRKFTDKFSLEIVPIFVHKNVYDSSSEQKDNYLIGSGARYKLTKRLSLNIEYVAKVGKKYPNSQYEDLLSTGLDIETGGHVFQLVFSNSQQMNDVSAYTNARGKWNGGSLYFGFNMYREF